MFIVSLEVLMVQISSAIICQTIVVCVSQANDNAHLGMIEA